MTRKIFVTAAVVGFSALFSVVPAFADPSDVQAIKLFYQALSDNKPELLDQILAPDWQDIPVNQGQAAGRDGFKPFVGGFHTMFPDLKVVNDDIIDAGDKVIVRSTISGTQAAAFGAFPSKGKPFSIMAIDIHQFKDGKVVQTWHVEDWLGGLYQMGAFDK
ncbi:ester cyclase [Cypionkella sp.]|uniref:ester cyclase n=1 Tax=Cypionkella sp. TaxID=2811411 RepID=UPI00271BF67E|nr:ester cyclase [Cypionkella sp.]MDO8984388.1 ester cyclase [Cypionkella sp.]MDP1577647.1 ester cyclase [Cypionkella sp.]MDP2048133.1 ester cyclase [Cypionkella sp.]